MPTLRTTLDDLASNFADSILNALRGASLDDLLGASGDAVRRGPGRPRTILESGAEPVRTRRAGGRLPRRSSEDIAKALDAVIALVKKNKGGLRAEEIRMQLGMASKEMPRVLKEGLVKKKLKAKGQKRATTYTA